MQCNSIKTTEKNGDLSFLGEAPTQWKERSTIAIAYAPREETTVLLGGMTLLQDKLVQSALTSLGERVIALPNPDFASFQTGKAFGNRGQCNPTYFTVGNLVKYLQTLHETQGVSKEEIVKHYAYVTAGGCGPCRFGMYLTEYKKALRDAGFDGFRIVSFEHDKGIFQEGDQEEPLLQLSPRFFMTLIKAVLIGDILNILGYKMRPYELEVGATDDALEQCYTAISQAFLEKKNLTKTLWKCRSYLSQVKLNPLQPKPKVMVMGEFWAAMTEGDGNYNLYRFLEAQGAECIPQPILNRLLLSIWEAKHQHQQKAYLSNTHAKAIDFEPLKQRLLIESANYAVKGYFTLYAKAIGLHDYTLPNMEKLAHLAKKYYTLECEGGEGHLEVAHLIESVKENLSHLTLSVKPFGCMPSSAVSDGIQSLVTQRYPEANFLSIETSGEGAANFYSRVQMALFKAKELAKEEFVSLHPPQSLPPKYYNYLYQPKNKKIGTAATLMEDFLTNHL